MPQAELDALYTESRELWVPASVPRVPYHPTALEFCSRYVARNTPVVLTGVPPPPWADCGEVGDCLDGLIQAAGGGDCSITVNWSPHGLGDHIDSSIGLFVKPHEQKQSLQSFVDDLRDRGNCSYGVQGVPYYSMQNSNLTEELPNLCTGLPVLDFADAAFGAPPEACNLWIGDDRSRTVSHKDHAENCYFVFSGAKRFVLRPPCDVVRIEERLVPAATYKPDSSGVLRAVKDEPSSSISWIPPEARADKDENGALVVTVSAGEMLYLPSLWYHSVYNVHVGPKHTPIVAVNFWYPMAFDSPLFVYYSFLRRAYRSKLR
jgi:peptidyl-lysine (3S)-dioxygenase / protease